MTKLAKSTIVLMTGILTSPAFAQITKVNTVLTSVETLLVSIGLVVFTICIMWAAYRYAFQSARVVELGNLLLGGALFGGAAGIAAWLIA